MCHFLTVRPVCPTCLRLLPDDDVNDPLITDPYPWIVCDIALRDQRLCPDDHLDEDYTTGDHINVLGSVRCKFCCVNQSVRILRPLAEAEEWREKHLPDRVGTQAARLYDVWQYKQRQVRDLLEGFVADAVTDEVKQDSKPIPVACLEPPASHEYLRDIYLSAKPEDRVQIQQSADPLGHEMSRIRLWAQYGRLDQSTSVLAERLLGKFWAKPALDHFAKSRVSATCLFIACRSLEPEAIDKFPVICGRSEMHIRPVLQITETFDSAEMGRVVEEVAQSADIVGPKLQVAGLERTRLPTSPEIIRHAQPSDPYGRPAGPRRPTSMTDSETTSENKSNKENRTPDGSSSTDDDQNDDDDNGNGPAAPQGGPSNDRQDTPDEDNNGPISRPSYIRTQHDPLPYSLPSHGLNWSLRKRMLQNIAAVKHRRSQQKEYSGLCEQIPLGQHPVENAKREHVEAGHRFQSYRKRKSNERLEPAESEALPTTKRLQLDHVNSTPRRGPTTRSSAAGVSSSPDAHHQPPKAPRPLRKRNAIKAQ